MTQQSFIDPEQIAYIKREWFHHGRLMVSMELKKKGWIVHSTGERDFCSLSSTDAEIEYFRRMELKGGRMPPHCRSKRV